MNQVTQYPRQLYQAPTPAPKKRPTPAPTPTMTDADLADRARKLAAFNREIGKHQAAIYELRNASNRVLCEIASGSDLDAVELGVCGLCGFAHEGECLND